ncbi:uncharacterized protein [Amphiura filiformis]|uniref:uncharacterized protein n=1 Tax=Amphiura filiformis TaxID=82378 RepID=UPI003B21E21F
MAHADHPLSLRSDDGRQYGAQYTAQETARAQDYIRVDSTSHDVNAQQETSGPQVYVGGAQPMSPSSNNDVSTQETSGSQSQVLLDDLSKWASALHDIQVWNQLIDKGSPSDLLVYLYFLKSEWASKVSEITTNRGERDGMEALLKYIIQSAEPTWPQRLQEGLIECGQKLLADRFAEKYEEICRRQILEQSQGGSDQPDGSMNEPPEPRSTLSQAIIQHRQLYEMAVRKHQKDLRKNINPLVLLKHIPYLHKGRIQAAMNTHQVKAKPQMCS